MPDTTTQNNSQFNKDQETPQEAPVANYIPQIIEEINKADNILVTLSRNPAIDEITAALGLTIFLDKLGKHATAIYSGATPNMLEFLKPEETFETNTNSLQDFIVALNKSKADHLRYNVDGDYVKIFITPYKTTIEESDLEFSHGDFNVDLVIALNVPSLEDLDAALFEHGRILHDAFTVDITTGTPGKFGGIEWSAPDMSSVSEMVANLIFTMQNPESPMEPSSATALLSGIIAATNRFSNSKTYPSTMNTASELMKLGADQQLISSNLSNLSDTFSNVTNTAVQPEDPTQLDIEHEDSNITEQQPEPKGEPKPEETPAPEAPAPEPAPIPEPVPTPEPTPTPNLASTSEPIPAPEPIVPTSEEPGQEENPGSKDYGKMIDEALAETTLHGDGPVEPAEPLVTNMAAEAAPPVMNQPEANSVPPIDYTQNAQPVAIPNNDVLPPPPPPPVDAATPQPEPTPIPEPVSIPEPTPTPESVPTPEVIPAPEPTPEQMPNPEPAPTTPEPGTFQIPGM